MSNFKDWWTGKDIEHFKMVLEAKEWRHKAKGTHGILASVYENIAKAYDDGATQHERELHEALRKHNLRKGRKV